MKIVYRFLKLSGETIKGKETPNKELEKFLFYENKTIMKNLLSYIQNDLTSHQIEKFIKIGNFDKVFRDREYQCVVRFSFSPMGDLTLNVVKFGKRDMYKEMKQQRIVNFESGVIRDDNRLF